MCGLSVSLPPPKSSNSSAFCRASYAKKVSSFLDIVGSVYLDYVFREVGKFGNMDTEALIADTRLHLVKECDFTLLIFIRCL